MRLRIVTPMRQMVEIEDVVSLRAEDETGSFGIRVGHTDFLTVLAVSVISWKTGSGEEGHAAVRGGVLQARGGQTIEVATRDAVFGASLSELHTDVLERFRHDAKLEELSKSASAKLNFAVIGQLQKYLEAGRLRVSSAYRHPGEIGEASPKME